MIIFDSEKLINRWQELGFTNKEIAEATGRHESSISRQKKNGSDFSASDALTICDYIGESMDMFVIKT